MIFSSLSPGSFVRDFIYSFFFPFLKGFFFLCLAISKVGKSKRIVDYRNSFCGGYPAGGIGNHYRNRKRLGITAMA